MAAFPTFQGVVDSRGNIPQTETFSRSAALSCNMAAPMQSRMLWCSSIIKLGWTYEITYLLAKMPLLKDLNYSESCCEVEADVQMIPSHLLTSY